MEEVIETTGVSEIPAPPPARRGRPPAKPKPFRVQTITVSIRRVVSANYNSTQIEISASAEVPEGFDPAAVRQALSDFCCGGVVNSFAETSQPLASCLPSGQPPQRNDGGFGSPPPPGGGRYRQ